jgi:ribosomal protein S18 acetylase RimI-like enzyme
MGISVRWMRREDTRRVVSIRKSCGFDPDLLDQMLLDAFSIFKVAQVGPKIVGFIAYKNGRKRTKLLEVAVPKSCRRTGVATALLQSMAANINFGTKNVEATVSEYNLPLQMLLKKVGFVAVEIIRSSSDSDYKFVMSSRPEIQGADQAFVAKVSEK